MADDSESDDETNSFDETSIQLADPVVDNILGPSVLDLLDILQNTQGVFPNSTDTIRTTEIADLGTGMCVIPLQDARSNNISLSEILNSSSEDLQSLLERGANFDYSNQPNGPAIEPYVPHNPYPFDYPDAAASWTDAPEGEWPPPGAGYIPRGWTGAPPFQPSVIPPEDRLP